MIQFNNIKNSNCHPKQNIVFGNFNTASKIAFEHPEAKNLILKSLPTYFYGLDNKVFSNFLKNVHSSPQKLRKFLNESNALPQIKKNAEDMSNTRANILFYLTRECIKGKNIKPQNYLDIGAGSGKVTERLAKLLKVSNNDVKALEIYNDPNHSKLPFQTIIYDGNNIVDAIDNQKYDAISIMATLHHSKNPGNLIEQAHKILSPDGILIIQKHNNNCRKDSLFHTFMDEFEYKVVEGLDNFQITHNYRNKNEWKEMIEKRGFKTLNLIEQEGDNPFKRFLGVFQKVPQEQTLDAYKAYFLL